jgi:hypothetical protein
VLLRVVLEELFEPFQLMELLGLDAPHTLSFMVLTFENLLVLNAQF